MMARMTILVAALLGASGVGLGAYQAHGLERLLESAEIDAESQQKRMDNCLTAVRYQMMHALAILGVGCLLIQVRSRMLAVVAALWFVGTTAFAGPLYLFAMAGSKQLIHVVPLGGVTMIVGWLMLGVAAFVVKLPQRAEE